MASRKRPKTISLPDKKVGGFNISYQIEGGQTFAVGYCPYCGQREESMQQSVDAGIITAGKLKTHINMSHPEYAKKGSDAGEDEK